MQTKHLKHPSGAEAADCGVRAEKRCLLIYFLLGPAAGLAARLVSSHRRRKCCTAQAGQTDEVFSFFVRLSMS